MLLVQQRVSISQLLRMMRLGSGSTVLERPTSGARPTLLPVNGRRYTMPSLIVSGQLRVHSWRSQIAQRLRVLLAGLFDSYRPELHYMRGPGPKWRAKHCKDHPRAAELAVH